MERVGLALLGVTIASSFGLCLARFVSELGPNPWAITIFGAPTLIGIWMIADACREW